MIKTEAEAIKFLQNRRWGRVANRPLSIGEVISMISSGSLLILVASIGSNHANGYRVLLKVIELVIGVFILGYAAPV